MSKNIVALIELINSADIKAFEKLAPKQKAMTIYKDFERYYGYQAKANKAKTDEEKDRYYLEVERHFAKANKQIRLLSEEEVGVYISYAKSRVLKAIDGHNESRYTDYKLLFGTVVRQMPKELNEDNSKLLDELKDLTVLYEDSMVL